MTDDTKFKKKEQYERSEATEQPNLAAEMENKTNSELIDEAAALDIQVKKLEIEYKKQEMEYRTVDMALKKDEFEKLQARRAAAIEAARSKTLATMQFLASREANQKACNHRKGGRGPDAVMRGRGDDANYAVVPHGLPDGSMLVLCQRCGKEWYSERKWNTENGVLKPIPATPGFDQAINFNTDNSPSGSSRFVFEKVS